MATMDKFREVVRSAKNIVWCLNDAEKIKIWKYIEDLEQSYPRWKDYSFYSKRRASLKKKRFSKQLEREYRRHVDHLINQIEYLITIGNLRR